MKSNIKEVWEKHYKPKKVTLKDFTELVKIDPTTIVSEDGKPVKTGRYTKWILREHMANRLLNEDVYKATQYLGVLTKFRFELKGIDVMKIKGLPDLYETVKDLLDRKSVKEKEAEIKADGLVCLYNEGPWQAYRVDTWEASKLIGAGTQWCTASAHSNHSFVSYSSKGPLIVFIKNKTEKYQYHCSVGIYNCHDRSILQKPCYYNRPENDVKTEETENQKTAKEINQVFSMIYHKIYGFGESWIEKAEVLVGNKTVLTVNGKEYIFKRTIFNDQYVLMETGLVNKDGYSYDNRYQDSLLLDINTGEEASPKYSEISVKSNNLIEVKETKKSGRYQLFLVLGDDGKPKEIRPKFPEEVKEYINSRYYYYVNLDYVGKDLIINTEEKSFQVDIDTGNIKKDLDVYTFSASFKEDKYYFDKVSGDFIKKPKIGLDLYRVVYQSGPTINEYRKRVTKTGNLRVRYNTASRTIRFYEKDKKLTDGKRVLLTGWDCSMKSEFIYIKNSRNNGVTSGGLREILITPYGWAFVTGREHGVNDEIWYTVNPRDYLPCIELLKTVVIDKKGLKPKKLGRKKQAWFENLI